MNHSALRAGSRTDPRAIAPLALLVALAALAAAVPLAVVFAHGGGVLQLGDAPAGPYNVSVWTQEATPAVGVVHFTAAVTDPETQRPLLYHEVAFQLTSRADEEIAVGGRATHELAVNKLYYELDLDVPAPGEWDVSVSVAGPKGQGAASFVLVVKDEGTPRIWAWAGAAAGLSIVVAWIITAARRATHEPRAH